MSSEPGSSQVLAASGPLPAAELAERAGVSAASHSLGVRRMFGRVSPTYDRLNHLLSFGIDRRWRARALDVVARHAPDGPLLDSCAGTLDLAAAMQQRWPERALVAADFSREMLLAGGDKLRRSAPRIVCDAMQLPFAAEHFAALTCAFGVRNLSDPARAAREARRVLAPGGLFLVLEFFRPTRLSTRVFHRLYARTLLPWVGRIISGDKDAYSYLARSMRGFLSRAEFEQELRTAGFRSVQGVDLTFGVASLVWGVK